MNKTVKINSLQDIFDVTFVDELDNNVLTFLQSQEYVLPGDFVIYEVSDPRYGKKIFTGKADQVTKQYGGKSPMHSVMCMNLAQLSAIKCYAKATPEQDDTSAMTWVDAPRSNTACYLIRYKGDGLQGGITHAAILSNIVRDASGSTVRLIGESVRVESTGLDVSIPAYNGVGVTVGSYYESEIKKYYPNIKMRYTGTTIEFIDLENAKVIRVSQRELIAGTNFTISLKNSASKVCFESVNVDSLRGTYEDIPTTVREVPLPPFINSKYHKTSTINPIGDDGELYYEYLKVINIDEEQDIITLSQEEDAGSITNVGFLAVDAGQDIRKIVTAEGNALCKDKYGWDSEMLLVDDEYGIVTNTDKEGIDGAYDRDYTDRMRKLAKKYLNQYSKPTVNGIAIFDCERADIRPGDILNIYDDTLLQDIEIYVYSVMHQYGKTQLNCGSVYANYIESDKMRIMLADRQKEISIQTGLSGVATMTGGGDTSVVSTVNQYMVSFFMEGLAQVDTFMAQRWQPTVDGTFTVAHYGAFTAPTGSDLEMTIYEDGISMGESEFILSAGSTYGRDTAIGIPVLAGHYYEIKITQIGSTYEGESVYINLLYVTT